MISLDPSAHEQGRALWMQVGPGVGYGISDDVAGQIRTDRRASLQQSISTIDICVSVIEGYFQSAPMTIQRIIDGKAKRVKNHPLAHLVEVAPWGTDTATEWIGVMAQEFERTGNALGIIHRHVDSGMVVGIEPFTLADCKLQRSKDGTMIWQLNDEAFSYNPASGDLPPIFHAAQNRKAVRRPMTQDGYQYFGCSPVRAARIEAETNIFGSEFFRDQVYLGGRGQVAIVDGNPPDQTDRDTLDRASKELTENLSNPANRGTVPVFPKYSQVIQLAADMEFLQYVRYSDEKLTALYKVPIHFINNMERATYSNIQTVVEHFVTRTMMNKYLIFEAAFKRQVIGYKGAAKNLHMKFVTDDLIKADPVKQAARMKAYAQQGAYTINEIREKEGTLDPLEGEAGEQRYINGKLISVGSDEDDAMPPDGSLPGGEDE